MWSLFLDDMLTLAKNFSKTVLILLHHTVYVDYIGGDQMDMAALFWYFVKRDASCTVVYATQVTFHKVPEIHSHV